MEKPLLRFVRKKITLLYKDICVPGPLWPWDNAGPIQALATCTKGKHRKGLYLSTRNSVINLTKYRRRLKQGWIE